MKKFLHIILVIVIAISTINIVAFANEKKKTVKIGYVPNYTTIIEPIKKGYEGYGYEYFMAIAEHTGWEYEFVPCTWNEGLQMLRDGEIQIMGPMGKSENVDDDLVLTENSFGTANAVLIADMNSDIGYNDIEAFDGKSIGVVENSIYIEYYNEYLTDNSITADYVYIDNIGENDTIDSNLFELRLTSGQYLIPNTKVVAKLGAFSLFYFSTQENADLIREMDIALKKIETTDFLFPYKLHQKYFGDRDYAVPVLTNEEKEALLQFDSIRVGYGVNYSTMQYQDDGGVASGVCIDILQLISGKAEIPFEFVPVELGKTYDGNDFDISISFTEAESLNGFTDQSIAYVERSLMMIGHPYSTINTEKNVIGILDYSEIDETNLSTILTEYEIKYFTNIDDIKLALINGEISHMVATAITVDRLLTELGSTEFSIYTLNQKLEFKASFNKDTPVAVKTAFNKLIQSIDDDTKDAIYIRNVSELSTQQTLYEYIQKYPLESLGLGFTILLVIFAIIIWALVSKRKLMLKMINIDSVTGLDSYYKFRIDAEKRIAAAKNNELMLISIDIDNFKYINELYGYSVGTDTLKIVANQMSKNITQGTIITRVSADEFLLLTHQIPLENIEKGLNVAPVGGWHVLHKDKDKDMLKSYLHFSIGLYYINDTSLSLTTMIDYAGIARKSQKSHFGDTVSVYTQEMKKQGVLNNNISSKMQKAIENREFVAYLQPQIDLGTNLVIGAEVLVRWIENGKIIPPISFIPIFEKNGFIQNLDLYMFEEACRILVEYELINKYFLNSISVNISRYTLLQPNITQRLKAISDKYNLNPEYIEIEITETAFTNDKELLLDTVAKLRNIGYLIAIDDFGCEYSSLTSLYDIPLDVIKLDKGFIDLLNTEKGMSFVLSTIDLLRNIDCSIVAEGIEDDLQADILRNVKCEPITELNVKDIHYNFHKNCSNIIGQGYLFSRPITVEEFLEYVKTNNKL